MHAEREHTLRPLYWAAAAYVCGVMLHVDRFPIWASIAVLALVAWRLAAARWRVWLPGGVLRVALGAGLLLAVLVQFATLSGLAAGSTLLAAMGAVKLLETRSRRDQFVVLAVALFLMLAACLDRQQLTRLPLYALHVWLACAALAIVAHPQVPLAPGRAALLAGRAIAFALPLAVLLFLFFPRFSAQIWALPSDGSAVTGLSNEMSPGAISQLSESDEPAFRARFEESFPQPEEMYWRGPVLHQFDGYTWRREPGRSLSRSPPLEYLGTEYRYRVTLEPHQRNWWFALDLPVEAPAPGVFFTFDYQLVSTQPVTSPTSYEARSHTAFRNVGELSLLGRRNGLQLPAERNRRSVALGRAMRATAGSDRAFVDAVLERFRTEGFLYTLTPPRLDLDSVDDFLFNTKRGFCGHYASAFVTLMRAGGIPARVVTGYHGGEWNPIGGYFIVRQSDAHAWAEVWLEGRGWTRVDPTSVVAPDRLQRAARGVLGGSALQRGDLPIDLDWIARIRLSWDTLNTWWKDRVIEFDLRTQLDLLRALGFDSPSLRQLGWIVAAVLVAWLGWIALAFARRETPPSRDALAAAYRRLCERLAAAGIAREPSEGPLSFAERLTRERPDLAPLVVPVLERYARVRYGPAPGGVPGSLQPAEDETVREIVSTSRRLATRRRAA